MHIDTIFHYKNLIGGNIFVFLLIYLIGKSTDIRRSLRLLYELYWKKPR